MKLRVALLPSEMTWPAQGVAVVIDVLRATSVITQAIGAGAAEVVVCGEIEDAFERARDDLAGALLCGERACRPIEGFDLGNSPSEYTASRIAGKTLVMTTTNGTRAVLAAAGFERIYAACFNNLSAVVARLMGQSEITIICAGTDGAQTDEDVLLAGAILHALLASPIAASPIAALPIAPRSEPVSSIAASPIAPRSESEPTAASDPRSAGSDDTNATSLGTSETTARQLWRAHLDGGQTLSARLRQTLGGRNLVTAGYDRDIEACAAIDTTDVVPVIAGRGQFTFRRSP